LKWGNIKCNRHMPPSSWAKNQLNTPKGDRKKKRTPSKKQKRYMDVACESRKFLAGGGQEALKSLGVSPGKGGKTGPGGGTEMMGQKQEQGNHIHLTRGGLQSIGGTLKPFNVGGL